MEGSDQSSGSLTRAARAAGVNTRGTASGAPVCSSKNEFGRPKKRWYAKGDEAKRARWRRVQRKRPGGGTLKDSTQRRAERLISRAAVSIVIHERMNEADNRKARTGGVANRGPAAVGIPAKDPAGEL